MKTTHTLEFTKGSQEALGDLDMWFQEFYRVLRHLCGTGDPPTEDKIVHLLSQWPMDSVQGKQLRLDQASPEYLELEKNQDLDACYAMLKSRLYSFKEEPVVRLRKAEKLWDELYWPGTVEGFHCLFREATMALRKNHVVKNDYEIVFKYQRLLPLEFQ